MSFLEEIKSRNVVRVALAYVTMSWLVLQGVDVALNNVDAPDSQRFEISSIVHCKTSNEYFLYLVERGNEATGAYCMATMFNGGQSIAPRATLAATVICCILVLVMRRWSPRWSYTGWTVVRPVMDHYRLANFTRFEGLTSGCSTYFQP